VVGGAWDAAKHPTEHRTALQQRIVQPQMSFLPKLRNLLNGKGVSTLWVFGVWYSSSVSEELPAENILIP